MSRPGRRSPPSRFCSSLPPGRGRHRLDRAKGRAGVGPVEIDPAIAARQGGAVGLSVYPGPQERLQVSGRQLLLGDGVAQLLVDAYRQRAGSGKDRRIALDEQIVSAPVTLVFRLDRPRCLLELRWRLERRRRAAYSPRFARGLIDEDQPRPERGRVDPSTVFDFLGLFMPSGRSKSVKAAGSSCISQCHYAA